jgi:hypothetical protein
MTDNKEAAPELLRAAQNAFSLLLRLRERGMVSDAPAIRELGAAIVLAKEGKRYTPQPAPPDDEWTEDMVKAQEQRWPLNQSRQGMPAQPQPASTGEGGTLAELAAEWTRRAKNMKAEHFYDTAETIELMIDELGAALRSSLTSPI